MARQKKLIAYPVSELLAEKNGELCVVGKVYRWNNGTESTEWFTKDRPAETIRRPLDEEG